MQQQQTTSNPTTVFSTLNQNVSQTLAKTTSTIVNLTQAISSSASALVSGQSIRVNGKEEASYRARDLIKSADDASNKWMQREVEYAKSSAEAYKQTINEAKNTSASLKPMRDSVGGLAMRVGVARSVASNLLADSQSASEASALAAADVLSGGADQAQAAVSNE
jgi:hypothetical protein